MENMEKVFKDCKPNQVFKKCKSEETGHDCIVMLEKPVLDFKCNESRKSVINQNRAKFRCNGLLVVTIFDLTSQVIVNHIMHKTDLMLRRTILTHLTHYEVGKIVKPDWFDSDLNDVCAHGIHYFLTLESAFFYDIEDGCCVINGSIIDNDGNQLYPPIIENLLKICFINTHFSC
jgi:hypothetical protein